MWKEVQWPCGERWELETEVYTYIVIKRPDLTIRDKSPTYSLYRNLLDYDLNAEFMLNVESVTRAQKIVKAILED